MKIGIITLPFNWNYGGILQNYALQEALQEMGHEAVTINRNTVLTSFKLKVLLVARRSVLKLLGQNIIVRPWPTKAEEKIIRQHTDMFIAKYIVTTELFRSESDFATIAKYGFDAFIVGSDQVWRPKYSPVLENHFLAFLGKTSNTKRIAYAASFGVENWEFSETQTKTCRELVSLFDAVSVRENTGISLCREFLQIDAVQVLDPSMLIPKEKYIEIIEREGLEKSQGNLFYYVLDDSTSKMKFIQDVEAGYGWTAFSSTARGTFRDLGKKRLEECIFPPVAQWIRGFMDAEFVITDSFHGTAFAIIFNKPFVSIGNRTRGNSRFASLLNLFGLQNRLVTEINGNVFDIISEPIDFHQINIILEKERKNSLFFLAGALTKSTQM